MMVWSLEMRGYRSGERKVRGPGENGVNNKNTFGTPYLDVRHYSYMCPRLWRGLPRISEKVAWV